jgi:hypothetical protein
MAAKRPKKGKLSKRVPAALTSWLRKTNPAFKGANAVRVKRNRNGSISVSPVQVLKKRGGKKARRVKNVERGFYDKTGFHPLRSSKDYDPDRAGDEY